MDEPETATPASVAERPRLTSTALPIALFSIPLGLAGLGGAWDAAAQLLGAVSAPSELAYAASAIVWATFAGIYVVGAIRHDRGRFMGDQRHPLFGPLTAYIPVNAILCSRTTLPTSARLHAG